jgi:two-component system chemotaxis sensor kinase CheA
MSAMDDALNTFIIESRELLEQMEAALLRVEQMPEDADTINAIFRAAHTIKGSAGLFGIEHIVTFTHAAESVLAKVRNSELRISSELVALFLAVRDHLGSLIELVAAGNQPDGETYRAGAELVGKLQAVLGGPTPAAPDRGAAPRAAAPATVEPQPNAPPPPGSVAADHWHISLRFAADVLRNGMDPLAFLRYLGTLGKIVHIETLADAVPPLSVMDPEACYLGFEIAFQSDADKESIEGAFEFVRDDAEVRILPPHSRIADYVRLIEALPQDDLRLGDMLVRCGTLTQVELDDALRQQGRSKGADAAAVPLGQVLVEQNVVRTPVLAAALDKQKQVRESKAVEASLIRVNADKLDEHINLIGELIIASAGTSLFAQRAGIPELNEAAARLSRLVEEVRDSALTLRMVQIGATFTKFQRIVRDMSAELKKDIRLEISGAETELDKTVVEKIGDPLTHLVRNSLDHGIEAADVRLARGKPAQGTIRLNAYHDSGSIVIEVCDDGGGLNKERIRNKAIERGVIKADQALDDGQIHELIFEPGLSTMEQATNLSGRGVGMDVVRRNITALRGSVDIESSEGVGTTMRIRLPLTLAIIDGFLVGVGASYFVVPLDMVVECVELTPKEIENSQGRDHLNLRGELLPFIRLRELFDISDATDLAEAMGEETAFAGGNGAGRGTGSVLLTPEGAAALAADPELAFILHPARRENIVVVQYAGHRAGLVVEQLLGEFQTVIRPLGAVFTGIQGISGFTILGNGHVALILDVPGLVRRVSTLDQRRNARLTQSPLAADVNVAVGKAKVTC